MNMSFADIRKIPGYAPIIKHGGWHLSYFGDSSFIKNKIESFSHQEFNKEEFTDTAKIEERISKSADLYDREHNHIIQVPIVANTYLPHEYTTYLSKYIN